MDLKKLQKKIDKALAVLSDHDDKKEEKRYIILRSHIEEAQDYLDKGNYSHDITSELYDNLKKGIKEFEEDRIIFMIFLTILCGLLFIGVFYITYSHFYDHWHPGGHIKPPKTSTTRQTTSTEVVVTETTTTNAIEDDNTTKTTKKTSSRTTKKTTDKTTSKVDETTKSTTSTTKKTTTKTTTKSTTTTTQVIEPDDPSGAFVTVIFDNSSLIDLENIYPVTDEVGLNSTPTKWSLSSELTGASRDYVVTYTINFVDKLEEIASENLMDITKLKYQLLIKKDGSNIYNSGVQLMKDYPEVEDGVRPIITAGAEGSTFNNGETLDFELRMWLDSTTGNDQQGKEYKFNIFVEATYDFID